jgi:hypothetical protein
VVRPPLSRETAWHQKRRARKRTASLARTLSTFRPTRKVVFFFQCESTANNVPLNNIGELVELKNQLSQNDRAAKVEGVKKVIAAMTVGKDVSSLFPSVVQCMQTGAFFVMYFIVDLEPQKTSS